MRRARVRDLPSAPRPDLGIIGCEKKKGFGNGENGDEIMEKEKDYL